MKVKLGLPSNLFARLSLEESLAKVWRLNPEAVELVLDRPHVSAEELEGGNLKLRLEILRSLSPRRELSAHANFGKVNPSSLFFHSRRRSLRILEACLKLSAEVNARVLVVHPGFLPPLADLPWVGGYLQRKAWRSLLNSLRRCLKLSEDYGVPLGLENIHGKRSPFSLPSQASQLAENLEGLRFTFDLGHAYIEARRLGMARGEAEAWLAGEMVKHFKGRLIHVHLHDNRGLKDSHLPPGTGEINFKPFREALETLDFQGQVILEIWSPKNPEEDGRRALEEARNIGLREGLKYVYLGNVPGHPGENTYCPRCGELLIERWGFTISRLRLEDGCCPRCGEAIPIMGRCQPSRLRL